MNHNNENAKITIALAGNPNAGKTTLFNSLTGLKQKVANYPGVTVETIFKSTARSWGETDLKNPEATFDEKKDLKGPLSMAVAVTKEVKPAGEKGPATKARLVVVGDSDFAVNSYFSMQGNGNLFLNMLSWLASDEDLISIRPKAPEDRRVILSQSQQRRLLYLTVFILPGAVLVAGISVWQRRKR